MSHREELLRAFRIGPDDMAANRAGRLGPGQVRRLRRNIAINVLMAAPFQAALIAFLVFAPRRTVLLIVIVVVLVAALTAIEVDWVRRIGRAVRAGVVESRTGPVTVHRGRGGSWLTVAGERSRLWTGFWHVGRGLPYRVYVVPAANLVVAMEPEQDP